MLDDDLYKIGNKINVVLKNGFVFTGIITQSEYRYIVLKDKYGELITIYKTSISTIKEVF